MSDDVSAILCLIREFTNQNNTTRSQAETLFNELLQQNPVAVCESLFKIINSYPTAVEAHLSAICIKNFFSSKIINNNRNSISNDFFLLVRNNILSFARDTRFKPDLNAYFLSILSLFYSYGLLIEESSFRDYLPFLISLLDATYYRTNALETLCQFFTIKSRDGTKPLQNHYLMIMSKCDLGSEDMSFRSKSFCFYALSIHFDINVFRSLPIPQMFVDITDRELNECVICLLHLFIEDGFDFISECFPSLYPILISRFVDENRDELIRVDFLYCICNMFEKSSTFLDFLLNNGRDFIAAVCIAASNPLQFPDLYNECQKCIQELSKIHQASPFYQLFEECIVSTNLFVASLFCRNIITPRLYDRALQFAAQSDLPGVSYQIVRHNGLSQIRKIIQVYENQIQEQLMEIGQHLIQLFNTFHDNKILKVLSSWCYCCPTEIVEIIKPTIISILQSIINPEIICCAAAVCHADLEKSNKLANDLLVAIVRLVNSNPECLSIIFEHIRYIAEAAGAEGTFAFVGQILPIILSDLSCLTSRCLMDIVSEFDPIMNNFAKIFFHKILEILMDVNPKCEANITFFALKRIAFYSRFENEFVLKMLQKFIERLFIFNENKDCLLRAGFVKCLTKLLTYYPSNSNILFVAEKAIIENFENEDNLYVISKYLILFSSFFEVDSNLLTKENIGKLIEYYPKMFDYSYTIIQQMRSSDITMDQFQILDITSTVGSLLTTFNKILSMFPYESTQLFQSLFLDIDRYDSPDFHSFFANSFCVLLTTTSYDLIANIAPILVQKMIILTNSSNISIKSKAINTLGIFFGEHEMPVEMIMTFIEIIKPLVIDVSTDQDLFDSSLSSLVALEIKYNTKLSDFFPILQIIIANLNRYRKIYKDAFLNLFSLSQLCFSNEHTRNASQNIVSNMINFLKNQQIEIVAIFSLFRYFSQNTEIPEIYQPLAQMISMYVNIINNKRNS